MRSKAQAASYPVGTRFVLGVMRLACDANHSTSTIVVSSWHGDKSRTGITTLPFCLYHPQHRNENLHVLDTTCSPSTYTVYKMDWICLVCSPAAWWSRGKSCHVKHTKNAPALQNLWYWPQCNNTLQGLLLISCIKISYFEIILVSMIMLEYMAIHLLNRLLVDKDRAFCNVMPHSVVHLQPPSLREMRCRNEHRKQVPPKQWYVTKHHLTRPQC